MPRRKVRGAATKARPHLELPNGDEGQNLTPRQRKQKLDLFLQDFDQEVENRKDAIMRAGDGMIKAIERTYSVEIFRIPKNILQMKMSDFLKMGGEINKVNLEESRQIVDSFSEKLNLLSTVKKPRATKGIMDTISEEENEGTTRTLRKRKGRTALSVSQVQNTATKPRPNTSKKTQFQTPAQDRRAENLGWDTPLVTPAFNPKLPKTPSTAIRRMAKPGERLVTYSLAGSPVAGQVGGSEVELALKLGKDKVLCLPTDRPLDVEMDLNAMSPLDKEMKNKLLILQQNLASMIEVANVKEQK